VDRPSHDARYAIDSTKIEREFGWSPKYNFEVGLCETVNRYLENENWWIHVREGGRSKNNVGWQLARWCVAHHPNDGEGGTPSVINYRSQSYRAIPT
jgi:hypothetical protein